MELLAFASRRFAPGIVDLSVRFIRILFYVLVSERCGRRTPAERSALYIIYMYWCYLRVYWQWCTGCWYKQVVVTGINTSYMDTGAGCWHTCLLYTSDAADE